MILTHELAQRIVESTMALVKRNVNIMNNEGVIIGSGHQHRINTFHKGARDVVLTGQPVEIYPENVTDYPGALPGVNLPIVIEGNIIGVVGVYGHPNEVRVIAMLVKMATELLLEREIILKRLSSRQKSKEHFVLNIISKEMTLSVEELTAQAKLLGYDLSLPRVVVVGYMRIEGGDLSRYYDVFHTKTRESVLSLLEKPPLGMAQDIAVFISNNLVVLKSLTPGLPVQMQLKELINWGHSVIHRITATLPKIKVKLAAGSIFNNPQDAFISYRQANFALTLCSEGHFTSIYDNEIMANYLLMDIHKKENKRLLEHLATRLQNSYRKKYDLITTLNTLLNCNLNLAETARALYIHRNTLLFRLKKFKELTGLEPHQNFNHALLCKVLLAMFSQERNQGYQC
ncbi:sugar diacid recognition domain-containing protein [Moorellaceae bacterium AZ2]